MTAVERLDATSKLHVHFDIFRALHAVLGSSIDRAVGALRESARVSVERRHGFQNSSRRRVHVLDRRAAAAGVAP